MAVASAVWLRPAFDQVACRKRCVDPSTDSMPIMLTGAKGTGFLLAGTVATQA